MFPLWVWHSPRWLQAKLSSGHFTGRGTWTTLTVVSHSDCQVCIYQKYMVLLTDAWPTLSSLVARLKCWLLAQWTTHTIIHSWQLWCALFTAALPHYHLLMSWEPTNLSALPIGINFGNLLSQSDAICSSSTVTQSYIAQCAWALALQVQSPTAPNNSFPLIRCAIPYLLWVTLPLKSLRRLVASAAEHQNLAGLESGQQSTQACTP